MRGILAVALLVFWSSAALAINCPIGSFPSVDRWGNQTCQSLGGGPPSTVQGSLDNYPMGTHPWVDQWGTKICKSYSAPAQQQLQLYDTSKGCPMGTYSWVDQ
jgi:hypothetical protein